MEVGETLRWNETCDPEDQGCYCRLPFWKVGPSAKLDRKSKEMMRQVGMETTRGRERGTALAGALVGYKKSLTDRQVR